MVYGILVKTLGKWTQVGGDHSKQWCCPPFSRKESSDDRRCLCEFWVWLSVRVWEKGPSLSNISFSRWKRERTGGLVQGIGNGYIGRYGWDPDDGKGGSLIDADCSRRESGGLGRGRSLVWTETLGGEGGH